MTENSSDSDSGLKGITSNLKLYVEKRLELTLLTISEQISFILADSIQRIIGIILLAGGFLIAWFSLSYYISSLVDSYSLGFFLSSLPLILGGITFLKLMPKSVTRIIQAGIIQEMMLSIDDTKIKQNAKEDYKNKEGGPTE